MEIFLYVNIFIVFTPDYRLYGDIARNMGGRRQVGQWLEIVIIPRKIFHLNKILIGNRLAIYLISIMYFFGEKAGKEKDKELGYRQT